MRISWRAGAVLFWLALGASAAAEDKTQSLKFTLGAQTPLAVACYNNALNGSDDYAALEPCDGSLESENLSQRKRAVVYANRGVIQFNIGEYRAAVSDFTKSLTLGVNVKAKIHANRGLAYEALGRENLARADYKAALAINPDYRVAKERLEELKKPLYDRSRPPRKITVEAPAPTSPDA